MEHRTTPCKISKKAAFKLFVNQKSSLEMILVDSAAKMHTSENPFVL